MEGIKYSSFDSSEKTEITYKFIILTTGIRAPGMDLENWLKY